jgi:hypothetical protein
MTAQYHEPTSHVDVRKTMALIGQNHQTMLAPPTGLVLIFPVLEGVSRGAHVSSDTEPGLQRYGYAYV